MQITGHKTITWQYDTSDRLAQMVSADRFGIYYTYEDHRDLRTEVANRYGSTLISSYAYTYDPINNRTTDTSRDDPAQALVQRTYTNNNLNQTTEIQKSATTHSLTYDADGNMTGLQTETKDLVLTYNAENRLVQAEPRLVTEGGQRGIYVYDYMGRRVEKLVYTFTSSAWQLTEHRQFVYDGWNLIEEIDLIPATPESKYYVWGLDLSESLQGAGGVGGLIAALQTSGTDYACFDGNGNLGQLVEAGTGAVVAHYEYDPFGNTITSLGVRADENPFRFSTKYYDDETGLIYYGYRYYSPEMGRWINRDPISEVGAKILRSKSTNKLLSHNQFADQFYQFIGNSPTNGIDLFGMWGWMAFQKCEQPGCSWKKKKNGIIPAADGCSAPRFLAGSPDNPGWVVDMDIRSACNNHDYCYSNCKMHREKCDDKLEADIILLCEKYAKSRYRDTWWGRRQAKGFLLICKDWADRYRRGVRIFGRDPYRNRQKLNCECGCP